MPRGDKSKYDDKQKKMAEHIEEGYKKRGVPEERAERIGWSTVNKTYGGGARGGSGSKMAKTKSPQRKGGHKGGKR